MADLVYPVYIDGLAIYPARTDGTIKVNREIPQSLIDSDDFRSLEWSDGDGYTAAFDQLCAVERTAYIFGHDPSNIGVAALIFGKWIAVDQSRLTAEYVR